MRAIVAYINFSVHAEMTGSQLVRAYYVISGELDKAADLWPKVHT